MTTAQWLYALDSAGFSSYAGSIPFRLFTPPLGTKMKHTRASRPRCTPLPVMIESRRILDPQLNTRPAREKIRMQIKNSNQELPYNKAADPYWITNRILQARGECVVDMIYMYMIIIWDVQTYQGAWALALLQSICNQSATNQWSVLLVLLHCGYVHIYSIMYLAARGPCCVDVSVACVLVNDCESRDSMSPSRSSVSVLSRSLRCHHQLLLLRRLCHSIPLSPPNPTSLYPQKLQPH